MGEPITLLFAVVGIALLGFVFTTIDVVKDVGRIIGLVLLVALIVLLSDRLTPWLRQQNFSIDRLVEDLRNLRLNPFAVRVSQPGWQDLPYILSNQPPPARPVPVVPPPSRPSGGSSAANFPQTVEPYLNGGVAPAPQVVPPYSNRPSPVPPSTSPSPPPGSGKPIPGLW